MSSTSNTNTVRNERLMDMFDRIKMTKEDMADWWDSGFIPRAIGISLVLYLLICTILAFMWSGEPSQFDVVERAEKTKSSVGSSVENSADQQQAVVIGSTTATALIEVANTMMEKPGGFLSNDILPPGVLLDNIPSWEFGVLVQVRDLARAMRENFSRSQSQSTEDIDLAIAEPRFNFDNQSWILPRSEDEYQEGIEYTQAYLLRLSGPNQNGSQFYARADNLNAWLATVETRLGSLSQRLSASVGQKRLNVDLAGEAAAGQSTASPQEIEVKTAWNKIDNVLFEARGTTWALIHFLKAIEVDFADVLEKKNARVSVQQIIRELESTQQAIWSPVVLNGSGFGLFANHSLVMASYVSRANAGIIDLRELLSKG